MSDIIEGVVSNLAATLRDAVSEIEAEQWPATRNNYGAYMAIFSQFADDIGQARILALALKRAGANAQGVEDALRISF